MMTNAITEADAEDSSTPAPVEPNNGKQEEQSEYDSSNDEETTEEDLPEEAITLGTFTSVETSTFWWE